MRKLCYECVRKHLGEAFVYMERLKTDPKDRLSQLYVIGHMSQAAAESEDQADDGLASCIRGWLDVWAETADVSIPFEGLCDYTRICEAMPEGQKPALSSDFLTHRPPIGSTAKDPYELDLEGNRYGGVLRYLGNALVISEETRLGYAQYDIYVLGYLAAASDLMVNLGMYDAAVRLRNWRRAWDRNIITGIPYREFADYIMWRAGVKDSDPVLDEDNPLPPDCPQGFEPKPVIPAAT